MAPAEPPTEITVRVKVPPGHIPDSSADEFTLGILSASTHIGDLRQQIQQLLPSHPTPDRQRLLYAGRALVDNDQTLASALNTRRDTSQVEYVLHLLVKGEQGAVSGPTVSSRRGVSSAAGGGLLSTGSPLEQGNAARATPQANEPPPQGLPQLPHGPQQPPYNLQQAQHLALLQQRQAQMQQMQNLNRQHFHLPMNAPQHPIIRPTAGHPMQFAPGQFAPGQMPQQQNENNAGSGQNAEPGQVPDANPAAQNETAGPDTQPASTNEVPGQQPQQTQGPRRPVSGQGFHVQGVGPNGNRFEIHQQTLNIPFPGQQGQMGMPMPPGMGLPFPLPGMAQQQRPPNPPQQPAGPSALDRARQNVAEMRQMLNDMRNTNATEEDRARTERLQQHIQAVNDYIDPFSVGRPNPTARSSSPFPPRMAQSMRASPSLGLGPFMPPPRAQPNPVIPGLAQPPRQPAPSTSEPTCYLLSSPQGPQALLFSPQHGTYTGSFAGQSTGVNLATGQYGGLHRVAHVHGAPGQPAPTPTQPADAAQGGQAQAGDAPAADPAIAAAHQVAQQINQAQQAQARPAQEVGPLQFFLGHFWLLLRVLIFAYFILGTNMGWRRPVLIALAALGYYAVRAGLLGDGAIVRRWWEGVMNVDERPRQQAQAQGEGAPAEGEQRPGQLPTPEELAQRLIRDRQQALDRAPLHRIREHLRPVERAAALFLASFWPGVGEAHVRAREAEERRLAVEEVERRRREEEERQRAIEAEKTDEAKEAEGSADAEAGSGDKPAVESEAGGSEKPAADKGASSPSAAEDRKDVGGGESEKSPLLTEQTQQ